MQNNHLITGRIDDMDIIKCFTHSFIHSKIFEFLLPSRQVSRSREFMGKTINDILEGDMFCREKAKEMVRKYSLFYEW
jgi:hypothetical protein